MEEPRLSWKYSWMKAIFGWRLAKYGQQVLLKFRWHLARWWDKAFSRIGDERPLGTKAT
jgi:hypothetical protein